MWTSALLAAGLLIGAGTPEVRVETLDGKAVEGRLAELSAESVRLETPEGSRSLPIKDLLSLSSSDAASAPPDKGVVLELADGSRLVASEFTLDDGVARAQLADSQSIEFPAKHLRSVRFDAQADASAAWPKGAGAADLLAVRKKEAVDYLEGVVSAITADHVDFRFAGDTIPVKRTRVAGVRFYQKPGENPPAARCIVEDVRGWRLHAGDVKLVNDVLQVTIAAGPQLSIPLDRLARLDYSAGKIVYLSDLDPESVKWTPLISFGDAAASLAKYYAPRRDRGREHQPIMLEGKRYAKGLALYSRTSIVYRLPAGASRFKALAGIDDAVREGGHVRLQISADDKKLLDTTIAGTEGPQPIDLDVSGARRLSILVDYGDELDAADHLDLADARIVK